MNKFAAATLIKIELQTIEKSLRFITQAKQSIPIDSNFGKLVNAPDYHKLFTKIQELRINLKLTENEL